MGKKILIAVVLVFAVIGLIGVIGFTAMWLMHGSMMGEMCSGMENRMGAMSSPGTIGFRLFAPTA